MDSFDKLISGQGEGSIIPPQPISSQQPAVSPQPEVWEADGGGVICAYCEHQLPLIHRSDGTHQLIQQTMHPKAQRALPGLFS